MAGFFERPIALKPNTSIQFFAEGIKLIHQLRKNFIGNKLSFQCTFQPITSFSE